MKWDCSVMQIEIEKSNNVIIKKKRKKKKLKRRIRVTKFVNRNGNSRNAKEEENVEKNMYKYGRKTGERTLCFLFNVCIVTRGGVREFHARDGILFFRSGRGTRDDDRRRVKPDSSAGTGPTSTVHRVFSMKLVEFLSMTRTANASNCKCGQVWGQLSLDNSTPVRGKSIVQDAIPFFYCLQFCTRFHQRTVY